MPTPSTRTDPAVQVFAGSFARQHAFRYRKASPRPSDRSAQTSSAGNTPAASSPPASVGARPRSGLRVMRRDQRKQTISGQRRIHLGQELLAPRHLLLHHITETGKGGLLRHQKGSPQALFQSVGSCWKRQVFQTFPDMKTPASDQNQRPRPYQPPPPSKATTRTMMRIVVKSMNFSPVGALPATAAQDEQSISHDWHSIEHYGAIRSPALTWVSAEALDAGSKPVQTDAGHRGTRENAAPCDESPLLGTPHSGENSA